MSVEPEPRGVDLHDDAFLHLRDRIVGSMQRGLELAAIFLRRAQRIGERSFHPKGAQFTADHRLQVLRAGQRHCVACPMRHVRAGGGAVGLFTDHDQRHFGGQLVTGGGQVGELCRGRRDRHQ